MWNIQELTTFYLLASNMCNIIFPLSEVIRDSLELNKYSIPIKYIIIKLYEQKVIKYKTTLDSFQM